MSRIANYPVDLPGGVEVKLDAGAISVKGAKGTLTLALHSGVDVEQVENSLQVKAKTAAKADRAMSGTTRALLANMVQGVTAGFERRLQINGVGYRAQAKGRTLGLTLGFSHPVEYDLPDGIEVETPTQTEVVVKGMDKQLVGQVAAEIRAFRPPEPYKGKGVRYADERVRRKEAKKK